MKLIIGQLAQVLCSGLVISAVVEIAIAGLVRDETVVILRGVALLHCSAAAEAAHEVIYSCCHDFVLLWVVPICLFKSESNFILLRRSVIHLARLCVQLRGADFVWWIGRRVGENSQILTRELASHLTKNGAH